MSQQKYHSHSIPDLVNDAITIKIEKDVNNIKVEKEDDYVEHKQLDGSSITNHNTSQTTNGDKSKLLLELIDLKKEISRLYLESRTKDKQIDQLKKTVSEIKEELTMKLTNLSNEHMSCSIEVKKLKDSIHDRDIKIENLLKEREMLSTQVTELVNKNNDLSTKITAQNHIQNEMNNENKHLSARVKQLQFGIAQNVQQEKPDENVYEVEKIIGHKFNRNKRMFLIRWKGYDESHDSWENEANLNCPKILQKYLKSLKN